MKPARTVLYSATALLFLLLASVHCSVSKPLLPISYIVDLLLALLPTECGHVLISF